MDHERVSWRRRSLSAAAAASEDRDDIVRLRDLGSRLKLVRTRKLKLKIEPMARLLGVSAMAVSKWENGKTQITDENLAKFASESGVSLAWLKTGIGVPERGQM